LIDIFLGTWTLHSIELSAVLELLSLVLLLSEVGGRYVVRVVGRPLIPGVALQVEELFYLIRDHPPESRQLFHIEVGETIDGSLVRLLKFLRTIVDVPELDIDGFFF